MAKIGRALRVSDMAAHEYEPGPMVSRGGLNTTLDPELVRIAQESAARPWYIRHPVLTVVGVGAAGFAVWHLVRYLGRRS